MSAMPAKGFQSVSLWKETMKCLKSHQRALAKKLGKDSVSIAETIHYMALDAPKESRHDPERCPRD